MGFLQMWWGSSKADGVGEFWGVRLKLMGWGILGGVL